MRKLLILSLAISSTCFAAGPIETTLVKHKAQFQACYMEQLKTNPKLEGTVVALFKINSKGKAVETEIKDTTLENAKVENCVLDVIKKIDFPLPKDGGSVEIKYPFKFHAEK